MEIHPGIHRVECPIGERYVALYLLVGAKATMLIDTGYESSIQETLLPYMAKNGLSLDSVRYVINTHSDYDHSGGNKIIRQLMPNALLCCGERDRAMIVSLKKMIDDRYNEFELDHGFAESPEAVDFIYTVAGETNIDIGFSGGERIDLGNRFVEVLHTPGHSWGHLSIWDETTRVAIIGDAILGEGVLLADGSHAFPPTYRFVESYRATMHQLKVRAPAEVLTSHYPRYVGQSGIDFIDLSLAYADLVERIVLETVESANSPLTLLEIIEITHGRLGVWPDPTYKYLVYPVLGHLEVLESYKKISRSRNLAGLVTFLS